MGKRERTVLSVWAEARKCQVPQPNISRRSCTLNWTEAALVNVAHATWYCSVSPARNGTAASGTAAFEGAFVLAVLCADDWRAAGDAGEGPSAKLRIAKKDATVSAAIKLLGIR